MFERDALWALPGVGWVCWRLGGSGQKWIRRFAWPIVIAFLAFRHGIIWWCSIVAGCSLLLVHSLGYSTERIRLDVRAGIGLSFGYALLPILWSSPWLASTSGLVLMSWFLGSMAASRRFNWFTHGWVEGGIGFLQGWYVAAALLR